MRNGRETTAIEVEPPVLDDREFPLAVPGESVAYGRVFRVHVLDAPPTGDLAAHCSPRRQIFDAAALGKDLVIRCRRPGDRFTPMGMDGTKKLKDYFADAGVPAWERDRRPLLVAGGRIVWVVGGAISGHAAVGPQTKKCLEIEVADAAE